MTPICPKCKNGNTTLEDKMKRTQIQILEEILTEIKKLNKVEASEKPAISELTQNEDYWIIEDDGKQKTSEIIAEMRKLFPVWVYNENKVNEDFPQPKKPTKNRFRARIEADEELKNKSANDLGAEGIKGITLRERLLMELMYFRKTGKHLDIENITLCGGSRDPDGHIPVVHWSVDVLLCVDWHDASFADPRLRSRQVII